MQEPAPQPVHEEPDDHSIIESWFDWPIELLDFPRFRSVTVVADVPEVCVRTRTGGNNRDAYEEENDALCLLEGYVDDQDDDYDHTYAYWTYSIPERSRAAWKAFCAKNPPVNDD